MDNSTRSLRRLPARSAKSSERSSSKSRTAKETDTPEPTIRSLRVARKTVKESDSKKVNKKSTSPPRRRSRSRSNARRRLELVKETKKEVVTERLRTESPSKLVPGPATKIISRLKEGIEQVRNSVSPEVEDVVRRSLSRFEEVTHDIINNVVTRRDSSRQSRGSSASLVVNNVSEVSPEAAIEEEEVEEARNDIVTNHTGVLKKEKSPIPTRESKKVNYLKVSVQVLLGLAICAFVVTSHVVCTKDDCRLLTSNLSKALDYTQYFDSYSWPVYSLSLILLFVGCQIVSQKQRKPPFSSIIGGIAAVTLIASIWACHQYFEGLKGLRILQLIGATIAHTLVLIAYAGTSNVLGNSVQVEALINISSSISMVLLNASLWAVESARTSPNQAVLVLGGLQASLAFDQLLFPPLSLSLGPVGLLWLALRPFILLLPQVYISANNAAVGKYAVIGIVSLHSFGYILYRYSSIVKNIFLRDPYSQRFSKSTTCGDYSVGPWGLVRHPQLLGLLLCELSWIFSVMPNPVSAVLAALSVLSMVFLAQTADRRLSRTYRAKVKSSLLPFVPY